MAKLTRTVGPLTITHLGQLPAVTLSFNLKPGVSLGDVVPQVEDAALEDTARHHHHQLSGHRAGVSIVASKGWAFCWSCRFW